jgi:hypothetical protein
MFKNRALKVTMIKDEPETPSVVQRINIEPEKINQIIKDQTKNLSAAIVAVYVAKSVTDVARNAAIQIVYSKFK